MNTEKLWFFIDDEAGIGRDRNFTIGKGIKGVQGNVRRNPWREFNNDFDMFRCIINDPLDLDLILLAGFDNRFN